MIRVVITGSECTGKTTLAAAMAGHYGVPCVPEFARQFVEAKGAAPEYTDVELIARGQIETENRGIARARGLLIQDTDLLSTVTYSHHYWGDCPAWVEAALRERLADLYLLADIDVPWVADGDQRDRGDRREEMQELFRRALLEHGARHVEVRGPVERRLATAVKAIDPILRREE